jgi:uncharacterized protein YbbC (DUF1343 family)
MPLKPAFILILVFLFLNNYSQETHPLPAAYSTQLYFPILKGKKVALVGNQTSVIGKVHLLDTLLSCGINVREIFCPEHGFRGNVDAGESVKNSTDAKTGIKIISLYGKHYKPKRSDLSEIDVVVFDIQDVGVRFYTYLSTLNYVMEACAENNKPLIILDRPNPNGFYIDGPVLEMKYKSFVGLHPIPLVYGMTIGEYALMLNGEHWLKNGETCNLKVIPCINYTHACKYEPVQRPSPNLPNLQSIYLYPSLAFFEGTSINVGRGTKFPFQVFGHPKLEKCKFSYMPESNSISPYPMHKDTLCYGLDLCHYTFPDSDYFTLKWLIFAYHNFPKDENFFNNYFYYLSGSSELIKQIKLGESEAEIKESWKKDIDNFKIIRSKYLIYK